MWQFSSRAIEVSTWTLSIFVTSGFLVLLCALFAFLFAISLLFRVLLFYRVLCEARRSTLVTKCPVYHTQSWRLRCCNCDVEGITAPSDRCVGLQGKHAASAAIACRADYRKLSFNVGQHKAVCLSVHGRGAVNDLRDKK